MKFTIDSKVRDIFRSEAAKAVIEKHFPGVTKEPQMKLCYGMSYRKVLSFPQVGATPELFEEIDRELRAIEE